MKDFNNKVLVLGSGYMAAEYLKVLDSMQYEVIVVGRSKEKIESLKLLYKGFSFHVGGLKKYIDDGNEVPQIVINAVSINQLIETTNLLIDSGVKRILLEKPGALTTDGLRRLESKSTKNGVKIYIAFNRRFYASFIRLLAELKIDGGATSAHFEFTEWIHTIDQDKFDIDSLDRWILSNSSHVVDTVFSAIGAPSVLQPLIHGQNKISWHKSGDIFVGSGITVNDVPFTYHSNWNAPGRWAIEISTEKRRFFLKPMEKLFCQLKGSIQVNEIEIDYKLENEFKPGLYLQTKSFLDNDVQRFCSLKEQIFNMEDIYMKIGGYKDKRQSE